MSMTGRPLSAALRRRALNYPSSISLQHLRESSTSSPNPATPPPPQPSTSPNSQPSTTPTTSSNDDPEPSALRRRFESLAESAVLSSPTSRTITSDQTLTSSFTPELKDALAARLASTDFTSTHAQSISLTSLPSSASKHTRDLAAAPIWTGEERTEDAVLRMLNDAHKPLRGRASATSRFKPTLDAIPADLRPASLTSKPVSRGGRVAGARDAATQYAATSSDERAAFRSQLADRFRPEARVTSVAALTSLADQRIEDAIARGQFKDLPRGKPIKRDYNMSSPFLDTTEYFLNKMIQKQSVLPPWVEKQQELAREVVQFRKRLRGEWMRHVARRIAAAGGSVEEQCAKAEGYAKAEARRVRWERIHRAMELGEEISEEDLAWQGTEEAKGVPGEGVFRDKEWERQGRSFNEVSVKAINDLTRSYNLMAPELARKPGLRLERELGRCYKDVAPLVAGEIRERREARKVKVEGMGEGTGGGGVVEGLGKRLGMGEDRVVWDEEKPSYGFKDLWRDWFGRKE